MYKRQVRTEFRKARRTASAEPRIEDSEPPVEDSGSDAPALPPPSPLELWLLKYVLLTPELSHFAAVHLDPLWVSHPVVRRVIALHFAFGGDVAGLVGQFEGDDQARSLVAQAATERRAIPEPEKQLADTILRLRNAVMDREITRLTGLISDPALPDTARSEALTQLHHLRTQKRQPLEPLG